MEHVSMEELRKMGDTHMIVAALVATVTFTAGLSVPGGFNQHNDPDPGTAILNRHAAFKAFIVTDAIALMLSISAIVYYFDAARKSDLASLRSTYRIAGLAITEALIAMMIAFAAGTYAVLATSSGKDIAIAVCVIGSVTVLLNYLYFLGYFCSCLIDEMGDLEEAPTTTNGTHEA